jgi:uncharacterized repeat protein (TIGR01451 family)/CSLREA domain-containing protein
VRALSPLLRSLKLALLAAAAVLLVAAPGASAINFTVTTTHDEADASACVPASNDQDCSLREAIRAANSAATDDVITVPQGTFQITLGIQDEAAAAGDFDVLDNGKLTINGLGANRTRIDGRHVDRVFDVQAEADLVLTRVTVTNGGAVTTGAGIRVNGGATPTTFELIDGAVTNSDAAEGGGIAGFGNTQTTVTRSTISGNTADLSGAGIYNTPLGDTALLTVTNSTISGNEQDTLQPAQPLQRGGGGITNLGTAQLNFVTVTDNEARAHGGGIQNDGGTVSVKNSIVSGNTAADPVEANCDEAITSNGFNIEEGTTCLFGNTGDQNADPKLAPLGNYGGSTQTHLPLAGSPAIDNADSVGCLSIDQRVVPRPQGAGCEVGSVETNTVNLSIAISDSPDPLGVGEPIKYVITVRNLSATGAAGVTVKDVIPSRLRPTLGAVPSQGSCTGLRTVTCSLGNLPVGAIATITFQARAKTAGTVTNTATVTGLNPDPVPGNNSATTTTKVKLAAGPCANGKVGTGGADVLQGTKAGDRIRGLGGKDKLIGKKGADCLFGGKSSDKLFGGNGRDVLAGGDGKDILKGGKGKDKFGGGRGNDHILAADDVAEKINCGRGFDRVTLDPSDVAKNCEVVTVKP